MIVLCEETTFLIKPNTARFQTPNRTFSRMTKVESHDSNDREASRHDIKIRKMLPQGRLLPSIRAHFSQSNIGERMRRRSPICRV